jgi:hypothetical protein
MSGEATGPHMVVLVEDDGLRKVVEDMGFPAADLSGELAGAVVASTVDGVHAAESRSLPFLLDARDNDTREYFERTGRVELAFFDETNLREKLDYLRDRAWTTRLPRPTALELASKVAELRLWIERIWIEETLARRAEADRNREIQAHIEAIESDRENMSVYIESIENDRAKMRSRIEAIENDRNRMAENALAIQTTLEETRATIVAIEATKAWRLHLRVQRLLSAPRAAARRFRRGQQG